MSEKKEALTRVAAQDRATKTANLRGDKVTIHTINNTMLDRETQGRIEALLPIGEGNAIASAELVKLSGVRSIRDLQHLIEQERRSGALILSSSTGGYFLPENRAEISRYVATLQRRAISILRTLKTARQALKVLPNQEVLKDGEL